MLCEDCKKREATVHFKHLINDKEVTMNLCGSCAKRRGFSNPLKPIPFPLSDFLTTMVSGTGPQESREMLDKKCSVCGLTYSKFTKTGRLGCGNCFDAFRQPLMDLLRRIHGSNLHRGKRIGVETSMEPLKEEARLKDELKNAIDREDFERAAQIRDMIKELQSKHEKTETSNAR